MARLMNESDIVLTSNGRTLYEAVSLGVPTISVSQNERELGHTFGRDSGVIFDMGIVDNFSKEIFLETLNNLIVDYGLRSKISQKMLELDLRSGTERIIELIEGGYNEWTKNNYRG
jgi:spore coat polysaccharide biosynthesis predicted glycosyltransferase SpsG